MQLQSADCIFCAILVVTFSRVWFYELHILRTSVQLCMLQSGESRFCTILFSFGGNLCNTVTFSYTWLSDLRNTSGLQA